MILALLYLFPVVISNFFANAASQNSNLVAVKGIDSTSPDLEPPSAASQGGAQTSPKERVENSVPQEEIQAPLTLFSSGNGDNNNCHIGDIFIINMDSYTARYNFVTAQLRLLNWKYERFPAINGLNFEQEGHKLHPDTKYRSLSSTSLSHREKANVGAWQSHLQIYFKIKERNSPYPTLILEDDVIFDKDIKKFLIDHMHMLPADWEMLFLGNLDIPLYLHGVRQVPGTPFAQADHFFGAHGYLVRNSAVASKLIEYSNTAHSQIPDWIWLEQMKLGRIKIYLAHKRMYICQARSKFGSIVGNPIHPWNLEKPFTEQEIEAVVPMLD